MSWSDRLAELQELFIGLGVAVGVLVVVAWFISTFGTAKSRDEVAQEQPRPRKTSLPPSAETERATTKGPPVVSSLFISASAGQPMQRVVCATAVAGRGLVGDRYYMDVGHWSGTDECEVTIIAQERLDEIERLWGVRVQEGEHRRNVVTKNLPIESLAGRRFRIGSATFGYERPRPPCAYIQMITEPGMAKALGKDAGICVRCIQGGEISEGDQIVVSQITVYQALRYRVRMMLGWWQNAGGEHS